MLVTPDARVLLLRVAGADGDLWIAPGGRVEAGESAREAVERELREETGAQGLAIGPEVWIRRGTCLSGGRRLEETERFFLVPTVEFAPDTSRIGTTERARLRELRWWRIEEIVSSPEAFVPGCLGELLEALQRDGPPVGPLQTGE